MDTSTVTLGPSVFEVFEVASPDRAEYANYLYEAGHPVANPGGFQLALLAPGTETCSGAAEELLATLDAQALVLPTGTPAG